MEAFYKGYFSEISLGIMPQIRLEKEPTDNAIQVQASSSSSGNGGNAKTSQEEKNFLVNDGTTLVFKNGKKSLNIEPEMVKKINFFVNSAQEGIVKVNNVKDDLYNDTTVIFSMQDKEISIKPKFEQGKPIYEASAELTLLIEEVVESQPDKNFLKRNKEFFTPELIKKVEECVKKDMDEAIEFCKQNKIDLLDVYRYFNALKHKEFTEYYNQNKENYLDNIEYKTSVKIAIDY